MDNDNFEQQFTQKVKSTMPQKRVAVADNGSKLPLIIAIALAAITLVESIVLVITLTNYFGEFGSDGEEVVADYETSLEDAIHSYDDNGNLIALEVTCTADNGAKFALTKSKTYEQYSTSSAIIGSGSYSVVNDSLISLSGTDEGKVLYYDWASLADGLTIYDCEEDNGTATAE